MQRLLGFLYDSGPPYGMVTPSLILILEKIHLFYQNPMEIVHFLVLFLSTLYITLYTVFAWFIITPNYLLLVLVGWPETIDVERMKQAVGGMNLLIFIQDTWPFLVVELILVFGWWLWILRK